MIGKQSTKTRRQDILTEMNKSEKDIKRKNKLKNEIKLK